MRRILLLSLLFLLPGKISSSQDLATEALGILRSHCYSCHGLKHKGDPQYDVSNLSSLVSSRSNYIVPGKPEASAIIARIEAGEMPPKPNAPITNEELTTLKAWVKAGAKAPGQAKQPAKASPKLGKKAPKQIVPEPPDSPKFVPDSDIREIIARDLLRAGVYARQLRYLSLANLYNTGSDEKSLAVARAAVSKSLNSLSFAPRIYVPQAVDKAGLVLRIDLSQVGWSSQDWDRLLKVYPYNGSPVFLRADWFVSNALRPPLYYDLLHVPNTLQEFEAKLGINRDRNFLFNIAQRSAITTSGVAFHNRVLEWDPGLLGPYWISYDFGGEADDQNVIRNPLGPISNANPFVNADFRHEANEILAGLPNGLDAYYVSNAAGKRLNFADPALVADNSQITRTSKIEPGLSCITCHSQGKQVKFTDVARNGSPLNGVEQLKLLALYPDSKKFTRILERDRDRYVAATKRAIEPFLGKDAVSAAGVAEPIRPVVEHYNRQLNLEQAALEVGVKPQALKQLIYINGELQQLGLRPLLDGHTITRDTWENIEFGISPFQRVLQSFGIQ